MVDPAVSADKDYRALHRTEMSCTVALISPIPTIDAELGTAICDWTGARRLRPQLGRGRLNLALGLSERIGNTYID
jgi:hypothetical protein